MIFSGQFYYRITETIVRDLFLFRFIAIMMMFIHIPQFFNMYMNKSMTLSQ